MQMHSRAYQSHMCKSLRVYCTHMNICSHMLTTSKVLNEGGSVKQYEKIRTAQPLHATYWLFRTMPQLCFSGRSAMHAHRARSLFRPAGEGCNCIDLLEGGMTSD